jgi:hypothetical protein
MKKKINLLPLIIIFFISSLFFHPFLLQFKLPIPSDTIAGLYHPFRDTLASDYPNGIPYKNSLITDPVRQQYPWKFLVVEILNKFQLPLWNLYNFAGTPLLANFQSAVFYPLNFVLFIGQPYVGWSILVMLQPLLAGLFLYLYLNNLKLNKISSIFGSICFMFSGFMMAWLEWGTVGHTALWLPLVLLSIDKIFTESSYSEISNFKFQISKKQLKVQKYLIWSAIFIFALASSFFAGHLQTFFYLFLAANIYFILRWLQYGRSKKTLTIYLILNTLFLILTSVQWLPTLNFIMLSAREVDQVWQKPGWFIPWQNIIQFLVPDFFGNPTTLNYWGEFNYAEFIGYIGIFPLLMVLYALIARKDRETFFFGSLLIMSLIFAFPTIFAKVPYIFNFPFLSTSQPTRLLFITDLSLSILAALGLDLLIKNGRKLRLVIPSLIIGICFLGLWYFVLIGFKSLPLISHENIATAKRNLYLPSLLFAGSILLLGFYSFIKNTKLKKIFIILLLLLTVFDLYRFFHKFNAFTDRKYLFPESRVMNFLKNQEGVFRIMTTDDRILPPNFSIMYKIQSIDGYDPLYLMKYGELMSAVARNKPDISSPFGFNRIIALHNADSKLISLMGVKYVLSFDEIKSVKLEKVFTEGKTNIYKNHLAYDRAFFVEKIAPVSVNHEAINKMFEQNMNFKETAVVQDWDKTNVNFKQGIVNIVKYEENIIELEVKNKNDGFLVLMDSYYPAWKAKICSIINEECRETKIYLTNYNFRGIAIPKGEFKIIFDMKLL